MLKIIGHGRGKEKEEKLSRVYQALHSLPPSFLLLSIKPTTQLHEGGREDRRGGTYVPGE